MRATTLLFAAALAVGCSNQDGATTSDLALDLAAAGPADMTTLIHGCPPLTAPQTTPDGGAGGDTWANFAQGFFASYCTRCHSSTLTGIARNGAPDGFDWDVQATVLMYLPMIRDAVGVSNFMPPDAPAPTCAERQRLVRWIDADAP